MSTPPAACIEDSEREPFVRQDQPSHGPVRQHRGVCKWQQHNAARVTRGSALEDDLIFIEVESERIEKVSTECKKAYSSHTVPKAGTECANRWAESVPEAKCLYYAAQSIEQDK